MEHSCREADERRQMMLSQVLSSQARERSKSHLKMCWSSSNYSPFFLHYGINISFMLLFLSFFSIVARIALVKPEKARGVEDVILRAAQMGQIVEKVKIQSRFHVIVQNLVSTQVPLVLLCI